MSEQTFKVPHPGSREMPRWDAGTLVDAPRFTWKNWFALLGPGLVLLGVNLTLLPPALRPNWFVRIALLLAGSFFFGLGVIVITDRLGLL